MSNELLLASAQAYALLANEPTPKAADVVYIHGLTRGMVESQHILERGSQLAKWYSCPIAFNGSDGAAFATPKEPGSAWPGADYYTKRLTALDVDQSQLFPTTGQGLHTRDEADDFAKLVQEKGWRQVMIVSVGYTSVRAMSCHVAAMYTIDHPFAAYFAQPHKVNWDHPMSSSQRRKTTTARDELSDEICRLLTGWEKGDGEGWRTSYCAPPDMFFKYLEARDKGTLLLD